MDGIEILIPEKGDTELLDAAELLWKDFYDDMSANGLMLPMADSGEKIWRRSLQPSLGRANHLVLLRSEGVIAGFALGTLRLLPEYLGNKLIGFVSGIYIDPAHRRAGMGRTLYNELEKWFISKEVDSYELQVLTGNPGAIGFWEALGYRSELLQMRKAVNTSNS